MQRDNKNQSNARPIFKSFGQLTRTPEAKAWEDDEFPHRESLLDVDRRDFLKIAGASLALAGTAGCRQLIMPDPKAVPFVRSPDGRIPGKATEFATTVTLAGYGLGVVVRSVDGRPIKVEGNPGHPASLGSTDIFAQADILDFYDPDRSQSVIHRGEVVSFESFFTYLDGKIKAFRKTGGAGLHFVTEAKSSPTFARLRTAVLAAYPKAGWTTYEPFGRANALTGTASAFGNEIEVYYNLKGVKTILSLDSDFLTSMPGSVRYSLDFAESRRVRKDSSSMSRLYAIESAYSVTGAAADHRIAVRPSALETVAAAVAAVVAGAAPSGLSAEEALFVEALVADLKAGSAVVIPGDHTSDAVHHYAAVINNAIGALGKHVLATSPVTADKSGSLADVAKALDSGAVKTLVIVGGNPVYNAPVDVNFSDVLSKFTADKTNDAIRLSLYEDETSILCNWHLPLSHELESWGDAVAYDGTVSLSQPLIKPLYSTKSEIEYLSEFLGKPVTGEDLVRETYGAITDAAWGQALARGIIRQAPAPIAFPPVTAAPAPKPANTNGYDLQFRLDPTIHDGRYANNAWLQELPKPVTTLVWDNAAMISTATAKRLGIIPQVGESDAVNIAQYKGRKMVELAVDGHVLKVAVWILPGQPDETITLALGYGRTHGGAVAKGRGFNSYKVRTTSNLYTATAEAKTIAEEYELVFTQPHHLLKAEFVETKNRDIVRVSSFDEYVTKKGEIFEELHHGVARALDKPHDAHENHEGEGKSYPADPGGNFRYAERSLANKENWTSLYPEFSNVGYNQWAMTIDLTTCIGCNACTIACQAENNIPVVGKKEVARGREMHWIRLDHYYEGTDVNDPISHFMPVPCMQCEKAPCEPVCPVAATIHSHEGLNQMVYNRCVGTRYCSNNCPYKVRRFNFFKWTQGVGGPGTLDYYNKPQLKMLANPQVSVRGRGVMEKCTYCVQRINEVRIEAKKDGREIEDQQVRTACQQACPTQAIEFGDMMDPTSKVSVNKSQPHDYGLLTDLNTRPRTTYLARIRNTNSKLEKA